MVPRDAGAARRPVEVIAHRGYSARAPENTLAALRLALDAGANALEWDVHLTRDGVPVVIHDRTVNRTTDGRGAVASMELAELRRLDAGAWFGREFAGERVPTLEQALALASGRCRRVYPEVKAYRRLADVDRIVALIRATGWESGAVLISTDRTALERARAASAELLLGPVVERVRAFRAAVRLAAADGRMLVDARADLLLRRPALVDEAGSAGVELATWTVDDVEAATALVALGVHRITTNQVGRMVARFGGGRAAG